MFMNSCLLIAWNMMVMMAYLRPYVSDKPFCMHWIMLFPTHLQLYVFKVKYCTPDPEVVVCVTIKFIPLLLPFIVFEGNANDRFAHNYMNLFTDYQVAKYIS